MIETFGATFFGVIASFLLWYGGTRLVKWQGDKKAKIHVIEEIKTEIQCNIVTLDALRQGINDSLATKNIPAALSPRLRLSIYNYAVSSGELRLLSSQNKLNLITAAYLSESTNHFIENTELLLAIFQFKPHYEALELAKIRLSGLVTTLNEHSEKLKRILGTL